MPARTTQVRYRGRPMIDETGNRYGRLLVIERARSDRGARWLCRCSCGTEVIIRGVNLRNLRTQSCGCFRRERDRKLSADEVQAIRTHCRAYGYGSQTRVAQRFKVSQQIISHIMTGTSYREVPEDYLSLNARDVREIIEALDEYEQHLWDRALIMVS